MRWADALEIDIFPGKPQGPPALEISGIRGNQWHVWLFRWHPRQPAERLGSVSVLAQRCRFDLSSKTWKT
jgi:hypothetical protein